MKRGTVANFGANIKRIRVERGILQYVMADAIGIGRTTLADLERGARNPSLQVACDIALYLGVPTSELAGDAHEPEQPDAAVIPASRKFRPSNWTLFFEFNSVEEDQSNRYSEATARGDAAAFYGAVRKIWELDPSDPADEGDMLWSKDTITLNAEVLDMLTQPLDWALMHTIPKRVTLVCNRL